MKSGRELDENVAEAIGWRDFITSKFNGLRLGLPPGVSRPRSGNTSNHKEVPHYSTDISAAWQVVEKMRDEGWFFVLESYGDRSAPGRVWAYFSKSIADKSLNGYGNEAPAAICLAALAALGASAGEKEGKGER